MNYTFMNREAELFDIVTSDAFFVKDVSNLRAENARLVPIGMRKNGRLDLSPNSFSKWWAERRIPLNREGIENIDASLAEKSMGLSLSDQYWIRPDKSIDKSIDKNIDWKAVNFFHNSFSNSVGELLVSGQGNAFASHVSDPGSVRSSSISPDFATSGTQRKRWKAQNRERRLLKYGNAKNSFAQPYREEFASRLLSLALYPGFAVPYKSVKRVNSDGEVTCYSVCDNFINSTSEFVPMHSMLEAKGLQPTYAQAKEMYGNYGYVLDMMLIVDYIVLNIDRHLGNFGFIRSATTGRILKPAPIFDSGSSLLFDCGRIEDAFVYARPFHLDFDTQISEVNVRAYREGLTRIKDSFREVFWRVFRLSPEAKIKGRLEFLLALSESQLKKLMRS
ncbi:MAG: hypothetical protein LBT59_08585 [Clostridiales bacterium]|jgi:hypothetical protein|nr:hypothetical protein [Clostridiales bacterium]